MNYNKSNNVKILIDVCETKHQPSPEGLFIPEKKTISEIQKQDININKQKTLIYKNMISLGNFKDGLKRAEGNVSGDIDNEIKANITMNV